MPFRPQYDAIASMRSAMRSNSGPVGLRSHEPQPQQPALPGVGIEHHHQRVRVLGDVAPALVEELERQRDVRSSPRSRRGSGTRRWACRRSEQVKSCAGRIPWKQVASDSSVTLMRVGAPAPGPGVWSKSAVARRRIATAGHVTHARVAGARNADLLEVARESRSHCADDHRPLVLASRRARSTNTPFTWQARSSIGRPNPTAACPLASQIRQDARRRDRRAR